MMVLGTCPGAAADERQSFFEEVATYVPPEDGSETCGTKTKTEDPSQASFSYSLGDLKKNIEYLIGMEWHSGSMDVCSPLYVSRILNVPLEDVMKCMKEMGI